MRNIVLLAALVATPAIAQETDPALEVSQERLRADMDTIVGFGTRHTLSSQTDPERGIGAAVNWALDEFRRIGARCDNCLDVQSIERVVEADGRRIPQDTLVRNAVAIQRGTERPDEIIIVQGHYDSRVTDPLNGTDDAPGANDDGSGSVMILEAARILSQREYPSTIVYALLTGEEQGLYGAQILADWVEAEGLTVKAVLNNDMIGNSCGSRRLLRCGACPRVFRRSARRLHAAVARTSAALRGRERFARAAICRAGLPIWPRSTRMECRFAKFGGPTAWGGAGTRSLSSTKAILRCASPWRSRITNTSIRTCASRTA